MNKNCSICVYQDGMRADGTIRCTTMERQRDPEVTDCCIQAAPLRVLQRNTTSVEQFADVTNTYISKLKSQSAYWKKQTNLNGQ